MTGSTEPVADMRSAAAKFFTATHFAVAGASSNPSKFGHRIFAWYLTHSLHAIPLNPTCSKVSVRGKTCDTVPLPSALPQPSETSLSVITPPPVTAKLLREAKASGVKAVWLQPGSFGEEEMRFAVENFPGAAVGGFGEGTVGGEGWCVLVDGDTAMRDAEKLRAGSSGEGKGSRQVVTSTPTRRMPGDKFEIPFL